MGIVKRLPARGLARPMPPSMVWPVAFAPAPELRKWIRNVFLEADAPLFNEEHKHLLEVDFEVLWARESFEKQGRSVVGTAEQVMFRAGGWQKHRQEQQFDEWFGRTPKFLLTFSAGYAATCTDAEWCAVVEHELYHLGHRRDEFGAPRFTRDGMPVVFIRGHDVEEFVGVVRRYGVGHESGQLSRLVAAAAHAPEIGQARIASVCGTCLDRAA